MKLCRNTILFELYNFSFNVKHKFHFLIKMQENFKNFLKYVKNVEYMNNTIIILHSIKQHIWFFEVLTLSFMIILSLREKKVVYKMGCLYALYRL